MNHEIRATIFITITALFTFLIYAPTYQYDLTHLNTVTNFFVTMLLSLYLITWYIEGTRK
jgi:hypothetical protein